MINKLHFAINLAGLRMPVRQMDKFISLNHMHNARYD